MYGLASIGDPDECDDEGVLGSEFARAPRGKIS